MPGGSPPHCVRWKREPQQLFQKYLLEAGFEGVPLCKGYYWLRGENKVDETPKGRKVRGEANRAVWYCLHDLLLHSRPTELPWWLSG